MTAVGNSESVDKYLLVPKTEYDKLLHSNTVEANKLKKRLFLRYIDKELKTILKLKKKSPQVIQQYLDLRLRQLRKILESRNTLLFVRPFTCVCDGV